MTCWGVNILSKFQLQCNASNCLTPPHYPEWSCVSVWLHDCVKLASQEMTSDKKSNSYGHKPFAKIFANSLCRILRRCKNIVGPKDILQVRVHLTLKILDFKSGFILQFCDSKPFFKNKQVSSLGFNEEKNI